MTAQKTKKNKLIAKPDILEIRWYPGSKVCTSIGSKKIKLKYMPPLMVRKAEWRR